jgi:hypothetical protein
LDEVQVVIGCTSKLYWDKRKPALGGLSYVAG